MYVCVAQSQTYLLNWSIPMSEIDATKFWIVSFSKRQECWDIERLDRTLDRNETGYIRDKMKNLPDYLPMAIFTTIEEANEYIDLIKEMERKRANNHEN